MEHLWAPWRMQFINELRGKSDGCIFCKLGMKSGETSDRDRLVLYRGRLCYVLMNRYPYNNGHLMVMPYRHTGSLSDLTSDEHVEMMQISGAAVDIMTEALEAEGFNCGFNIGKAAGAGIVDHIHLHVVPRWSGDSNFLPIIGNTRSMPEYLTDTYDKLVGGFKNLSLVARNS